MLRFPLRPKYNKKNGSISEDDGAMLEMNEDRPVSPIPH